MVMIYLNSIFFKLNINKNLIKTFFGIIPGSISAGINIKIFDNMCKIT